MIRSLAALAICAATALALCAGPSRACSYTSAAAYAQPAQVQFAPAPACATCQQQAPLQVQATPAYVPQQAVFQAAPVIQFAPPVQSAPSYGCGVQQSFAPSFAAPSYGYGVQSQAFVRQHAFAAPSVGYAVQAQAVVGHAAYAPAVVAAPAFQRSVTVERRGLFGRRVVRSATVIGP